MTNLHSSEENNHISMDKDIVVFTLHKSASMFIHKQCEILTKISGIKYHSPNLEKSEFDAKRLLTDKNIWHQYKGCFAPIRFFVNIPNIDNYNIILHLRDPRDVLVSMFYSYCFIHRGEIAANTGYRKKAATLGIDNFVLTKASQQSTKYMGDYGTGGHVEEIIGNLPKRYDDYIKNLVGKPNVILVKYEEMVTNYRNWLRKFISPFPVNDKKEVIDKLVELSPTFFPERKQDAMTHIRHITPGDHKEKLKSSTIQQLNKIFSTTLDALNYEK